MRVTAPRADASVRPYSATGQYFNRHHLRCHILAVGLRVRGFFRLVGAVLGAVIPLPSVLVSAALEVSAGCADFAVLGGQAALYGCCAVLSLLGVSVWAQMQLFAGAAFCPQVLLASRLLHLVFLQGILRFCVRFLPGDVGVCSTLSARIVPLLHLPPDAAAVGFVFLCAALYKAWQNLYNK